MKTINKVDIRRLIPSGLIGETTGLSDEVMPVIAGQFYSYTTRLTPEKPIFAAMHCKANKARAMSDISKLGKFANLLFRFDGDGIEVIPVNEACDLNSINCSDANLGKTLVTPTNLKHRDFGTICSDRNRASLFASTQIAENAVVPVKLTPEGVFAFRTEDGRCGLFILSEATPAAAQIIACHTS